MKALWSRGSATAADIQIALKPRRSLRDSTIRTVLTRLEEKGYVQHEVDGRTFVYSSIEQPNNLAVRAVKQIVDRFCQGSVESLLIGMVDDEVVDPEELQRIASRLANERSARTRKSPKRRELKK